MDFTFDDQQIEFRDAIRKFLVVEAAPERLREYWETQSGRSSEMRQQLTDQGLVGLSVPEESGGLGLADVDWVLLLQEVGYHGIPDSLSDAAYLAVNILSSLPEGNELRATWLARMVEGNARIAVGHPINPFVHDAQVADLMLLWHNDEIHAITPDQATRISLNPSIDESRRLYKVDWTPMAETRVCDASIGADIWASAINHASFAAAAQLLGLAQCMLDLSVDYTAQRKQFGKPIGSFQAVKHHLADVAVKIEFAGPVLHRAAYALQNQHARVAAFVSHAKIAAGDAARLAARHGIQSHGAMGYTWEADLQMYMKRAWALDAAWGDIGFHKQRVNDFVLSTDAPLGPGETFSA